MHGLLRLISTYVHGSKVDETIKTTLNFFFFFYEKRSHAQKAQTAQKTQKASKASKAQNANTTFLPLDVFMRIKILPFLFLFACMRFVRAKFSG